MPHGIQKHYKFHGNYGVTKRNQEMALWSGRAYIFKDRWRRDSY